MRCSSTFYGDIGPHQCVKEEGHDDPHSADLIIRGYLEEGYTTWTDLDAAESLMWKLEDHGG